jgi:hypothetical protein
LGNSLHDRAGPEQAAGAQVQPWLVHTVRSSRVAQATGVPVHVDERLLQKQPEMDAQVLLVPGLGQGKGVPRHSSTFQ